MQREEEATGNGNSGVECGNGRQGNRKERILVVDDSPVDRKVVERLLKKSDCFLEVITVESGKKALEYLGINEVALPNAIKNHNIDIILTDYCMPAMNGYDLLKIVKEQSFQKPIPVVIMSSENEPQRISRCQAIGAEDFIIKPLQTKDAQRLRNCVRRTASASKAGSKRKMPMDMAAGSGGGAERRQWLAGVVLA
ncbi:hypothetical protein HPP92_004501 [Vanilla planifolia]|uniref:Response regulatory domain-containing protein n=1 Tax=Vanilla planifolia TaxID=51239 RepID=A0A835VJY2_VANPL|nr:hypothetical protein HPP92_004501 [Vanilla planifolia]